MIRLNLDTADVERLLQGKLVVKHKNLPGGSRARTLGVVIEIGLPRVDVAALQGALNRIIDGEGRELLP